VAWSVFALTCFLVAAGGWLSAGGGHGSRAGTFGTIASSAYALGTGLFGISSAATAARGVGALWVAVAAALARKPAGTS
jgi:hypothetical protein